MLNLRMRLEALHKRIGTASLILGVVALVLALAGGAFAAGGGLTGKQKKEVIKIAKKYAGKDGAPGAQGPQGSPGSNGANGKDGANGTPGRSVKATEVPGEPGEGCEEVGGTEFEVEGSGAQTYVCNGAEGSPWTLGGTLPSEKALVGVWATNPPGPGAKIVPISFSLPVDPTPAAHYLNVGGEEWSPEAGEFVTPSGDCPGITEEIPAAEPGQLCIYATYEFVTLIEPQPFEPTKTGLVMLLGIGGTNSIAKGVWAVTAE
jgi:hypothetical protein